MRFWPQPPLMKCNFALIKPLAVAHSDIVLPGRIAPLEDRSCLAILMQGDRHRETPCALNAVVAARFHRSDIGSRVKGRMKD